MKLELPRIGRKREGGKEDGHWLIGARSADCARRLVVNDIQYGSKENFTLRRPFFSDAELSDLRFCWCYLRSQFVHRNESSDSNK